MVIPHRGGQRVDQSASLTTASAFRLTGLVGRRSQRSVPTGPMLFAAFGPLTGPAFLGLAPLEVSNSKLHLLAEITLALISDGADIDLRQVRRVSTGAS